MLTGKQLAVLSALSPAMRKAIEVGTQSDLSLLDPSVRPRKDTLCALEHRKIVALRINRKLGEIAGFRLLALGEALRGHLAEARRRAADMRRTHDKGIFVTGGVKVPKLHPGTPLKTEAPTARATIQKAQAVARRRGAGR